MTDTSDELDAIEDAGSAIDSPAGTQSADLLLWAQAHRAAAQAAVATVLGARVMSLELHAGPPPVGVVHLGELGTTIDLATDPVDAVTNPADPESLPDHGRVRMLAYRIAGPIAERVAGVDGVSLQGEPAYYLATAVLALMREPDTIDEATDTGSVARLLLDHFGDRVDDAAEAAEHLAMNVEMWVSEHWGAIAVVAANLLRYRQLTGDGVRQLMPPMQAGPLA